MSVLQQTWGVAVNKPQDEEGQRDAAEEEDPHGSERKVQRQHEAADREGAHERVCALLVALDDDVFKVACNNILDLQNSNQLVHTHTHYPAAGRRRQHYLLCQSQRRAVFGAHHEAHDAPHVQVQEEDREIPHPVEDGLDKRILGSDVLELFRKRALIPVQTTHTHTHKGFTKTCNRHWFPHSDRPVQPGHHEGGVPDALALELARLRMLLLLGAVAADGLERLHKHVGHHLSCHTAPLPLDFGGCDGGPLDGPLLKPVDVLQLCACRSWRVGGGGSLSGVAEVCEQAAAAAAVIIGELLLAQQQVILPRLQKPPPARCGKRHEVLDHVLVLLHKRLQHFCLQASAVWQIRCAVVVVELNPQVRRVAIRHAQQGSQGLQPLCRVGDKVRQGLHGAVRENLRHEVGLQDGLERGIYTQASGVCCGTPPTKNALPPQQGQAAE